MNKVRSIVSLVNKSKIGAAASNNSPAILIGVGTVGFVATIVLSSRATLRVSKKTIPQHVKQITEVDIARSNSDIEPDKATQEKVAIIAKTTLTIAKEYTPSALTGIGTLACFFGAYSILKSRNAALLAAYTLVHGAFEEYRSRVKEELGEVYDTHFRYGTPLKEIVVVEEDPETGKNKRRKQMVLDDSVDIPETSMYARIFSEYEFDPETGKHIGSRMHMRDHQMNYVALQSAQNNMNDRLRINGHVFLNEVYEYLGLTPTKAGQIVGWIYKGEKDEGIQFMNTVDLYSYDNGDPIFLDFNVQGPIINDIVESG